MKEFWNASMSSKVNFEKPQKLPNSKHLHHA